MDRRSIYKITVAALAAVPLVGRKAAAAAGETKMHKVVLHVDENDAGIMRRALANARNCQELFAPHNEGLEIEAEQVALAEGVPEPGEAERGVTTPPNHPPAGTSIRRLDRPRSAVVADIVTNQPPGLSTWDGWLRFTLLVRSG